MKMKNQSKKQLILHVFFCIFIFNEKKTEILTKNIGYEKTHNLLIILYYNNYYFVRFKI